MRALLLHGLCGRNMKVVAVPHLAKPYICNKKKKIAVTPAGGPKEVAKEAAPPAPECAQGVKAQGL